MTRVEVKSGVPAILGRDVRWVQFTEPLPDWQHRQLGRWLAKHRQASLRVYGNYEGGIGDFEFLRHYPRIAGFDVDSMYGDVPDLSGLRHLPDDLERLHLGVASGADGERLLTRTTRLVDLTISGHKRLPEPMSGLRQVRTLYVEGPVRDLEVLSAMTTLEDLTLRSVTIPDLTPLLPLRALTSLDIKLGGIRNLALLPQLGVMSRQVVQAADGCGFA